MQPPAFFAAALKISWTLYSAAACVDDDDCVVNLAIAPNLLYSMNPKPPYQSNNTNINNNNNNNYNTVKQQRNHQQQQLQQHQQQRTKYNNNNNNMQICAVH